MKENFAVFILTHGRAGNVRTIQTLRDGGYTGDIYLILDDLDPTADEYIKHYGKERVIIFDKMAMDKKVDTADNTGDMRVVVHARNATWGIAEELGLEYFLVLDDDYDSFAYKAVRDDKFVSIDVKNLDKLFSKMLGFLDVSGALTVAFAQGGDFIGGKDSSNYQKGIIRKAMNTFFCRTDRPFEFVGRINEDTNTYVNLGGRGHLFFTITKVSINQGTTQANAGGLSDIYLDQGTYVKSFYSILYNPASVKIGTMGNRFRRLHHRVSWNNTVPKIISERYKK